MKGRLFDEEAVLQKRFQASIVSIKNEKIR